MMIEIIEKAIAEHTAMLTKRAENAERQLKIAEKELIDKDEQIVIHKRVIGAQNIRIRKLEETVERLQALVDQKNSDIRSLNLTIKALNEKLAKCTSTATVICERDRYAAALKDIEGTLCAASDHFKELSNSIHKVLE